MKVNNNISAMITNSQLLRTENSMAASMERLSSGLKINKAKDDPAGMAISNKMQAQIDGLSQASSNSSNGISVIQIAESSMNEITSIIQRMRELSVQAASDTNMESDREAMQAEISSLRDEIDRISRDTEYNTKTLLNGALDRRVYADGLTRINVSDSVEAGEYQYDILTAATQSSSTVSTSTGSIPAGTVVVNGNEVTIEAGESADSVYEKIREAAEKARVSVFKVDAVGTPDYTTYPTTGGFQPSATSFAFGDSLAFVSDEYGSGATVEITSSDPALAAFLGIDTKVDTAGVNMEVDLTTVSSGVGFSSQATVTTQGNRVFITDKNGFTMDFLSTPGMTTTSTGAKTIEVTDFGTMTLQIGANENQTMDVRIPEITAKSLYLDELDVTQTDGGGRGIEQLDKALTQVTSTRSRLGAYQNRLDHAVSSLDESGENMTAAISRIKDVDMAKEMSEYTKYNVLDQAGISVLAQANEMPQKVLQLLQ